MTEGDRELRHFVTKFGIHLHSPYLWGSPCNNQHQFFYDKKEVTPDTYIYETCKQVSKKKVRRRSKDGIVQSQHDKKNWCQIIVERIEDSGTMVYFIDYAFKTTTMTCVQIITHQEEEQRGLNPVQDKILNEIDLYMCFWLSGGSLELAATREDQIQFVWKTKETSSSKTEISLKPLFTYWYRTTISCPHNISLPSSSIAWGVPAGQSLYSILRSQQNDCPCDGGSPSAYVIRRRNSKDYICVARIILSPLLRQSCLHWDFYSQDGR